ERLRILPIALAETVKPLEKIGEVRIIDMGGGLGGIAGTAAGGNGGKADSLVDALLAYRAQSPVIDSLLKEAGFAAGGNPVASLISAAKANGSAAAPAGGTPQKWSKRGSTEGEGAPKSDEFGASFIAGPRIPDKLAAS